MKGRVVVLIGAPGVGKGTFASIICSQLGWKHLNIGATLRDLVAKGTPLGKRIRDHLTAGKLVPDALVNEIALGYLDSVGSKESILVDGYPRTVNQAELVLSRFPLGSASASASASASVSAKSIMAMHIKLDRWVCVEKLLARQECSTCGRGFNGAHIVSDGFDMPAIRPDPLTCPKGLEKCNPVLTTRCDDTRETIERRFQEFYDQTTPVLDVFRRRDGALVEFQVKKGVADAKALIDLLLVS
jgi:adenylate kinase